MYGVDGAADTTTKTYNIFKVCYDTVILGKPAADATATADTSATAAATEQTTAAANEYLTDVQAKAINTALGLVTYFERVHSCSGICTPSFFFWTLETKDSVGIPVNRCIGSFKAVINSSLAGLAWTSLIVGICLFMVWICQYCLWKKYEDNDGGDQVKPYKE